MKIKSANDFDYISEFCLEMQQSINSAHAIKLELQRLLFGIKAESHIKL